MPAVKPIGEIQKRYAAASALTERYTSGIEVTTKDWKAETLKADAAWKQGTADAAAKGLFAKGVGKVASEEWKSAALTKGGPRWGPGITAGVEKYVREVTPFLNAIKAITLPPRGPRGASQNYERVRLIGEKLYALRVSRG